MPISKRRKKKGKVVKKSDPESFKAGVSLQDLINVVAFQEQQKKPFNIDLTTEEVLEDLEGPSEYQSIDKENEDGR